eukprot:scaffold86548_cov55-Attheya_sp.AAC.2
MTLVSGRLMLYRLVQRRHVWAIHGFGTRVVQLVILSYFHIVYHGGSFSFFWISLCLDIHLDDSKGREAAKLRAPLGGGGKRGIPVAISAKMHPTLHKSTAAE